MGHELLVPITGHMMVRLSKLNVSLWLSKFRLAGILRAEAVEIWLTAE